MQENNSSDTKTIWTIVGIVLSIFFCCLALAGGGMYWLYEKSDNIISDIEEKGNNIINDIEENLDIPDFPTAVPTESIVVERTPIEDIPTDTLETLTTTIVPENDPYELACRLEGICDVPKTVESKSYEVGDKENFWILNSDTIEYNQIEATLLYATPHSYFWAEEGTKADKDEVKALMDTFEEDIYPTNREFFGNELNPGVDNDPHIYIFYAKDLGTSVRGFFNTTDEFNPAIKEHSNAHESFVIRATQILSNYGTLAHEFVHMIQFATDRNDVPWMAEGFAELGVFLNGYYFGGADYFYVNKPDLQLNDWADNTSPDFSAHYGQSFLYVAYYLDRFGAEATQALNTNPKNDLESIDDTLLEMNITDPQTGKIITADDVFIDWASALYLLDENVGDGRYTFHNYTSAPQTSATETFYNCPQPSQNRSVHQYGIDYISIQCAGNYTFHFDGATQTGLLPSDPYSGGYAFWSNRGDESDMTLTREFDLSSVTEDVLLSFQTWYDIEEDWDYIHLEASTDGKTWEILTTPLGTDSDPSGESYGWGYTGKTNGWIEEKVDLNKYAGKQVQVRFEYITDAAVNGEGMLIDDIRIDAIDYFSDFESDNGGWEANGYVRVQNILPQTFQVALILQGNETTVQIIQLSDEQTADIPISLGDEYDEAILVVTGTTRFTRELANYSIEIR